MEPDAELRVRLRAAYAARSNRVLDHVDAHLAEPLRLHELAAVACLSPYHFHRFHRVFAAMTGETTEHVYDHAIVFRLRQGGTLSLLEESSDPRLPSLPAGWRHAPREAITRDLSPRSRRVLD